MSNKNTHLKKLFLDFDKSGDGKLNLTEFRNFLSNILKMNVSENGAKAVFDSVNKDKDGFITVDEWLDSLDRKSLKDFGKEDIEKAFKGIDKSGDGQITRDELKAVLKSKHCQVSDADLDAMISIADKNKDNKISFAEFSNLFFKNV